MDDVVQKFWARFAQALRDHTISSTLPLAIACDGVIIYLFTFDIFSNRRITHCPFVRWLGYSSPRSPQQGASCRL